MIDGHRLGCVHAGDGTGDHGVRFGRVDPEAGIVLEQFGLEDIVELLGCCGGALVASGIVFTWLDQTAGLGRYQLLVSGVAVVVAIVLAPDGLTGSAVRLLRLRETR